MDRSEVLRQVQSAGGRLLGLGPERPAEGAVLDGLDSLARVELALALEDALDVGLPEEVVAHFAPNGSSSSSTGGGCQHLRDRGALALAAGQLLRQAFVRMKAVLERVLAA